MLAVSFNFTLPTRPTSKCKIILASKERTESVK